VRRRWWWILAPLVVLGVPLAWYLGSPLFLNKVVNEQAVAGAGERRGSFTGADNFHQGSGTAAIVRAGTQRVLRFEHFEVTNGPDLYVYLAVHPQPRSRQDVAQGFISLGKLKGNVGAQNYEIPAGTDLARYRSVVIYCRPFSVVFATATLEAAP
jgi:hypothetical protein